jgi:hypothetical protein
MRLTFPIGVAILDVLSSVPEAVEAKVSDLEDKTAVDHTVGRLQVAVNFDLWSMDERHTLKKRKKIWLQINLKNNNFKLIQKTDLARDLKKLEETRT